MDLSPLIIVLLLVVSSKSCLFLQKKSDSKARIIKAVWNDLDLERNVKDHCECGKQGINDTRPWNLYIHVKEMDKICSGTIITSNLIATSIQCFIYENKHLNLYDFWKPVNADRNVVYDVGKVTVSISETESQGETFPVEDIIYQPVHALKSAEEVKPPEFDIALIRVQADFTSENSKLRPICLPMLEKVEDLDLRDSVAFYYRIEDDNKTTPENLKGVIKGPDDEDCTKTVGEFAMEKNLCFRFASSGGALAQSEGGPLIMESGDTSFIIGLADEIEETEATDRLDIAYFTNLVSLIKYIEWKADKHGSTWCRTSEEFKPQKVEKVDGREVRAWETITVKHRNEVLDCDCGVKNPPMEGRIAGGEDAVKYEFGWMVLLQFYHNGRGSGSKSTCGGSIINDMLILTAAHCVTKMKSKTELKLISPDKIDAYIHVDSRVGVEQDPKATEVIIKAVLYYPDFEDARLSGSFDYDVALLVLQERLTLTRDDPRGIKPVCLPELNAPYVNIVGKKSIVVGWGLTNPDSHSSLATNLQKIELPIAPLEMCKVAKTKVTERMVCAGTLNRFKDAAGGDSGGPLMILDEKTNRLVEYGVVSWGENVRNAKLEITATAALYSDVQRLLPFVDYYSKRYGAKWCKKSGTAGETDHPPSPSER